jgi:hypothetical protein
LGSNRAPRDPDADAALACRLASSNSSTAAAHAARADLYVLMRERDITLPSLAPQVSELKAAARAPSAGDDFTAVEG